MRGFYYRPRRPAPRPRRRPPTVLVARGRVFVIADDLHDELRTRPFADALAELFELEQAEPEGSACRHPHWRLTSRLKSSRGSRSGCAGMAPGAGIGFASATVARTTSRYASQMARSRRPQTSPSPLRSSFARASQRWLADTSAALLLRSREPARPRGADISACMPPPMR